MLKRFLSITVLFFAMHALAAEPMCEERDAVYHDQQVMLHKGNNHQSVIYLLHNITTDIPLWLDHQKPQPGASAGWSSMLKPGYWSALMVSQPQFSVVCMRRISDKVQQIDCKQVLRVCRVAYFENQSNLADGTTFWLAEDAPYIELLQQIKKRKIFVGSHAKVHQGK